MRIRWIAFAVVLLLVLSVLAGQAAAETAVVTGKGVNVRSGPGANYDIVTTVTGGTEMECLDDGEGSWLHVRTPDGKEGYVSKGYVEMLDD